MVNRVRSFGGYTPQQVQCALLAKPATTPVAAKPTTSLTTTPPRDDASDDTEVAEGEEGEVCVGGACVTAGYLMREHMSCDPNVEAFGMLIEAHNELANATTRRLSAALPALAAKE